LGAAVKKRPVSRLPPVGAPEGTSWFGGPVDRFRITLRIRGEDLDPAVISVLLACEPTQAEKKATVRQSGTDSRIAKPGRWALTIESKECGGADIGAGIGILLGRLSGDLDLWATLAKTYAVDIFCGLFLAARNRGFELPDHVSRMLSERHLSIGFDIYLDADDPSQRDVRRRD
jgi:hypothetical protein